MADGTEIPFGLSAERMPQDLRRYISEQRSSADIPICEQEPAQVAFEVISAGSFEMKVYFPVYQGGETVVFMHLPGGICKRGIDRDRSWCSNMAKDSGAIYINVDYPSALEVNYEQILAHCHDAYELVRRLCLESWKQEWGTDPDRIVVSGSSFGFALAITVAAVAASKNIPACGLVGLVPLVDTNPDLTNSPWGENETTVGLTPDRLLCDLKRTFGEKNQDSRGHWHSNPSQMPDNVMRTLPRVVMVLATLDILFKTGVEFKNRLQAQGVEVRCREVDGLHYVKDMDEVTDAGRAARQFVKQESIEFMKQTKCSPS